MNEHKKLKEDKWMNEVRQTLSLNGTWGFKLDPEEKWTVQDVINDTSLNSIQIPGSWEEQGYGEPSEHEPLGTWKKEREYTGRAWYTLDLEASSLPLNQDYQLVLSGVRWFTEVYLDTQLVGTGEGLVTDQVFDLSHDLQPNKSQKLIIMIDNSMRIPLIESHIHSYHTATSWGGITGGARIDALPKERIAKIDFHPGDTPQSVSVNVHLTNNQEIQNQPYIQIEIKDQGETIIKDKRPIDIENGICSLVLDLGRESQLWSDTNPFLYEVTTSLYDGDDKLDIQSHRLGLRHFQAKGKEFLLNDQPTFLRGYVDCCIFPLTGYPVWDKAHYKKQFQIVKSHGFNHVRLHGWSAPKPFWEAADEEGMLVQTELPHWSGHYMDCEKQPPEDVHQFFKREIKRIVEDLNEHPSFVMLALGNELIGPSGHPSLNELIDIAKEIDPTRLYTDNTGFGQLPAHHRQGDYYIQSLNWHPPYELGFAGSPNTYEDYSELTRLDDKPLIGHEHGQFTMYADPGASEKFTGNLKPNWLNTLNESLEGKGWSHRVEEFQETTGKHMVRSYKEIMERARRTKGLSGVQLLDIRDFPGQGHATTGILDVFWDSKNVISPNEFKQFNGDRVLLMKSDRRTLFSGEELLVKIDVSNYGAKFERAKLSWQIDKDGVLWKNGEELIEAVETASVIEVGQIALKAVEDESAHYQLKVKLEIQHEKIENSWEFWSFHHKGLPNNVRDIWSNINSLKSYLYGAKFGQLIGIDGLSYKKEDAKLAVTDLMSRDVLQFLLDGGDVWLMAKPGNQYDEIETRYLPVFWNFLWFPTQESTTMGMKVNQHPLFNAFPHDGYSNWQWYHLVEGATSIGLDSYPQVEPIVEVVDNFHRMKKLTYAFEAKVGKGRLFVSAFKTSDVKDLKRPENSYLFESTLHYLLSGQFVPQTQLTVSDLVRLFKVTGQSVT